MSRLLDPSDSAKRRRARTAHALRGSEGEPVHGLYQLHALRPRWICTLLLLAVVRPALADTLERDAAFADRHPQASVLVLSRSVLLDVHFDEDREGISGERVVETVYWIRDRHGVDEANRQLRVDSPLVEHRRFEVEIRTPTGDRRRQDDGDLEWIPLTDSGDGIYALDRKVDYTVIRGLGPDDLLRVRETHEIRGLHGIPIVTLGPTSDSPVRESRVEIESPKDHALVVRLNGPDAIVEAVEETTEERRWRIVRRLRLASDGDADIEAGHSGVEVVAHFVAVDGDLAPTVFAAGPDWESVGRGYARRIREALRSNDSIDGWAREVVAGASSDRERVRRLYRAIQTECRYLGLFDGLGGILPESVATTAARRFGDCKGLSSLLIAMLRTTGLEAHPLLVRTTRRGPLEMRVPNLTQFDHFVVWTRADGEEYWLDPTYDFCPVDLVPHQNAGSPALLLSRTRAGLLEPEPTHVRPGHLEYSVRGALVDDGSVSAAVVEVAFDEAAMNRRAAFVGGDVDPSAYAERVAGPRLARGLGDVRFDDTDWTEPTRLAFGVRAPRVAVASGSDLFLPRVLLDVPSTRFPTGPRDGGLDLRDARDHEEVWSLALPPGATATADSQAIDAPGVSWSSHVEVAGDSLRVTRRFAFDERLLTDDEAEEFERAIEAIRRIEAEYLVVER